MLGKQSKCRDIREFLVKTFHSLRYFPLPSFCNSSSSSSSVQHTRTITLVYITNELAIKPANEGTVMYRTSVFN